MPDEMDHLWVELHDLEQRVGRIEDDLIKRTAFWSSLGKAIPMLAGIAVVLEALVLLHII